MTGVSRAAVTRIAAGEQLPVVLLAVAAGGACGLVGAHLAMPSVPLFAADPAVSTLDLTTSWGAAAAAALTAAALLHRVRAADRPGAGPAGHPRAGTGVDVNAVVASRGATISTRGLVHIYRSEGLDVAALSGVDLTVGAGEMVGAARPVRGRQVDPDEPARRAVPAERGQDLRRRASSCRRSRTRELDTLRAHDVGVMLQGAARNLLPYCTPAENVAFAQRAARAPASRDRPTSARSSARSASPRTRTPRSGR